jgi:glycosyltransferase involved in cell wall biosynthesis
MHPDVFTNSRLLMDAADGFVELGHEVDFYSASPMSRKPAPDLPIGMSIFRHWSPRFDRRGVKRRLIMSLIVSAFIFLRLLFSKKPDVMLVDTTGSFLGPCAWLVSKIRGHKYVYLATELFPDAAVALGFLRPGGLIARLWDFSNRRVYSRANAVIVIGPRLRRKVARHLEDGIDAPKLHVVHNWADPDEIVPVAKSDNWWVEEQGLKDKFIVLYSGNIGLSHDLSTLISAANLLKDQEDFRVLLIGEGPNKARLVAEVERLQLNNVIFLPFQPVEVLPYSLSSGDLSVVTLSADMEELTVPSKLYPAMAAGQGILALFGPDTDVGAMVVEYEMGIQIDYGDAESLARKIEHFLANPSEVDVMKKNARQVFEENFTRDHSIRAYARILEEAATS